MKSVYKLLLLAGFVSLFVSCDKDDDVPAVKYPLWEILTNQYWAEDLRFVYVENGKTMVSEQNILRDFVWVGRDPHWAHVTLGIFSIRTDECLYGHLYPDWFSLRQYDKGLYDSTEPPKYEPWIPYTYMDDNYRIHIDEDRQVVLIDANSGEAAAMNAVSGLYLNVLEASADRIVFDAPIKSFIREWWILEYFNGQEEYRPKRDYIGLRVTWTKFKYPELLDAALPLEEDMKLSE